MPDSPNTPDTTTEAPAIQSLDEIAAGVITEFESDENQPPEGGQADEGAAPAEEPAGDLDDEADDEATEEAPEPETTDEVLNALADLKREDVPEDLLPFYDDLIERRRLMQADYSRKTARVADESRELETKIQEGVQATLEQMFPQGLPQAGITPEPQAGQQTPDLNELAWEGLGEPLTIEQVMESPDPADLHRFIQAESRKVVMQAMGEVIMPQLQSFAQYAQTATQAEAGQVLDRFVAENPDLEDAHIDEAISLVERGVEPDLESAAKIVRLKYFGEQQIERAIQLGAQAERARAAAIQDNRQKFSTPSSTTKPAVPEGVRRGMSLDEVAATVVAEYEG